MKKILWVLVILATFISNPEVSLANAPVRTISNRQAQGNNTIATITVWEGSGINLNFIPTGEIIKKVWLDDPSRITLDFDGSMCDGSVNSSGCNQSGATVIHLRRIKPLNFPNLPQSSSTLLSVITEGKEGRKLYQFRVNYGSGFPEYYTVQINPENSSSNSIITINLSNGKRAQLIDIERGLSIAKAKNLINPEQENEALVYRVRSFLALVRNGFSLLEASQHSGVSMALIEQLAIWGRERIEVLTPAIDN